jgi:hypothetical protein
MKRKLLYLTTVLLFSVVSINAQTTVWDFSNTSDWPLSVIPPVTDPVTPQESYYQAETVSHKLGIFPGPSTIKNFGNVNVSPTTFSDTYAGTNRFQLNGGGGVTAPNYLPVQRYLYFKVDGPCVVKVWFRHGSSSGADRTVYVTDGANLVGSASAAFSSNAIVTANYNTVGGGKLYIYGSAANNLYKIEVTGANVTTPSLGLNDFHADAASNVYSNGKLVFVSNVKSDTKVDVYGISGVLIKSFKTGADTSFDLNTGIYVVRSKSAEGEKTAKVLVN